MGVKSKLEAMITKAISKTFESKIANASLKKQCHFIQSLIGVAGIGVVRTKTIKGMEEECQEKRKAGQTVEEIVEYYWSEPAFVSLWEVLGMDKSHLEVIAKGEQNNKGGLK